MRQNRVAILTFENDIHALAVQQMLHEYDDIICSIVETNRICNSLNLCWSNIDAREFGHTLPTGGGELLDVGELDVVWWRRTRFPQKLPSSVTDPVHIDLINNECRTALLGLLLNEFSGTWINEPAATQLAENKLVQLRVAQQAGFRVPRTLIAQDPGKIRLFCATLENKVIVKPLQGTREFDFLTVKFEEHLASDESLCLCPAIYQEYIPGNRHIRAHCFGDAVYAVMVESEEVDWRGNLDIPFSIFDVAEDVKMRLRAVLKALGLKMGIVDLKLTQEEIPIWLEINPQGQFLFAEALSGLNLTSAFAAFLCEEARQVSHRSVRPFSD